MYLIHYTIQLPYQSIIFSFLLTIGILYDQYATLIYTIRVRAFMLKSSEILEFLFNTIFFPIT